MLQVQFQNGRGDGRGGGVGVCFGTCDRGDGGDVGESGAAAQSVAISADCEDGPKPRVNLTGGAGDYSACDLLSMR